MDTGPPKKWPKWAGVPNLRRSTSRTLEEFIAQNQIFQNIALEIIHDLLIKPVRGRVSVTKGKVMLSVHPSDTLAAAVVWENAAGMEVPENAPTTWIATDMSGALFPPATLSAGADDQHETVTFTDQALTGAFTLSAQMGTLTATSEEIDVSPDNTPTQGVVTVAMA